jgi:hypothetical protein
MVSLLVDYSKHQRSSYEGSSLCYRQHFQRNLLAIKPLALLKELCYLGLDSSPVSRTLQRVPYSSNFSAAYSSFHPLQTFWDSIKVFTYFAAPSLI